MCVCVYVSVQIYMGECVYASIYVRAYMHIDTHTLIYNNETKQWKEEINHVYTNEDGYYYPLFIFLL